MTMKRCKFTFFGSPVFMQVRTEDELDRQVTLDQAGLEDRHREVVLEVHPAPELPR